MYKVLPLSEVGSFLNKGEDGASQCLPTSANPSSTLCVSVARHKYGDDLQANDDIFERMERIVHDSHVK